MPQGCPNGELCSLCQLCSVTVPRRPCLRPNVVDGSTPETTGFKNVEPPEDDPSLNNVIQTLSEGPTGLWAPVIAIWIDAVVPLTDAGFQYDPPCITNPIEAPVVSNKLYC